MFRSTNGRESKHGEVSRALWQKLWPERTVNEVPITHVTNGVHAPTWVAPLVRSLYERYVGDDWSDQVRDKGRWEQGIAKISDQELWAAHSLLKQRLVAFIRHRSFQARRERMENTQYTDSARTMFDSEALTIGFARRIAGYKRWSLLLSDPERLLRIINSTDRPVQFVFAGKAHPQDQGAKLILQPVAHGNMTLEYRKGRCFCKTTIRRLLVSVQSVDVWLKFPADHWRLRERVVKK